MSDKTYIQLLDMAFAAAIDEGILLEEVHFNNIMDSSSLVRPKRVLLGYEIKSQRIVHMEKDR